MKTIIAGTRTFNNYQFFLREIEPYKKDITTVICGGAKGADSLGEKFAKENNIPIQYFLPDWNLHGKKAGILRNIEMAKVADSLICFWDGQSRGSRFMIDEAIRKNLLVKIIRIEGI